MVGSSPPGLWLTSRNSALVGGSSRVFRIAFADSVARSSAASMMQTRQELYDSIGYWDFENKLDALFAKNKTAG